MKQYVPRRRRCWILLVQMDPVIHLSEGHRSDMLLDLSGLAREERIMVQAAVSNARDFDRVAEALIIQHPRIHLRENQRRTKGKGKDEFKRVDNPNTRWFREKGKSKHTGSKNLERVPITRISMGKEKVNAKARARADILFAPSWDNDLDLELSALLVQASAHANLSLGKGKGKGKCKGKSKGRYPVRALDNRRRLRELKAKTH